MLANDSFNGRLFDECLNASWFTRLADGAADDLPANG
jgi:hypothetical protein